MASPASASHPYSYQNASAMATRSLVSSQKPTETTSASSSDHQDEKPGVLKRQTTHNYEQALASSQEQSSSSSSDEPDRSGLDGVRTFHKNDYKRELMKQSLANVSESARGYTSTAAH